MPKMPNKNPKKPVDQYPNNVKNISKRKRVNGGWNVNNDGE